MSRRPKVHLNLNVRGMRSSATVAINEHSDQLIADGRKVWKLGLGQSPFPVAEPVVEALRTHAGEKDYLPVRGLRALRDAVADYHARRADISRSGDDVLIGPGSKELMFLLQLVYYGDLVIPTPAWVSYAPQAKIIGRRVCMVQTDQDDDWRLQPERLDELCAEDPGRPRIVILNYPANPTGRTYSPAQCKQLAKVAKRNGVVLLSDEIYGELHHAGEHVSMARYYPEGTIVSSGLSKWCGAGGWRLGTFLFPPRMRWLLDAMAAAASETFTSTSAPIQFAAVRAFEGGPEIERYLADSRRILALLGNWIATRLQRAGLRCPMPEGAFYLFPDFSPLRERLSTRGVTDSVELCRRLLDDTGVAILPGSEFGRPRAELTARLAYVNFDGAQALRELAGFDGQLDESFLHRNCPGTLEAIERICAWLE
ncbi:Aspartate aminotransferase [Enhygromyxa salina]|uniref:Aminotransferase n=1 Tax=Enhygromyxa salina TaxID=215803 RepID=A0A2S9YCD4_9BACT|nr:pyridoxal phosphate-dependent aminotransferase [Enhygromyxa salina]PRQ02774.1 Aspartate aminotransferase [Enhygromyxa salina]